MSELAGTGYILHTTTFRLVLIPAISWLVAIMFAPPNTGSAGPATGRSEDLERKVYAMSVIGHSAWQGWYA